MPTLHRRHDLRVLIPLAFDIEIHDGEFSWNFDVPKGFISEFSHSPIDFHDSAKGPARRSSTSDRFVIKFNCFWTIEAPPGYSVLFTHPANRTDLPFTTLTGLVDCDTFHDSSLNFPARWHEPNFNGVLPKGTPVAQCLPVKRESWSGHFEALSDADTKRLIATQEAMVREPGVYRRQFRLEALIFCARQELRCGARFEPEPTASRFHQRGERIAVALRVTARDSAKAFETWIAIPELQETMPEAEPSARVVRPTDEAAPKILGSHSVLADLLMRLSHAEQRGVRTWGNVERSRKGDFGIGAVSAPEIGETKLNWQVQLHRCDFDASTERLNRLVVALEGH